MFFTSITTVQYAKAFPDSVPTALWPLPPAFFAQSPGSRTPEAQSGPTLGWVVCHGLRSRAPPGSNTHFANGLPGEMEEGAKQ